MLFKIVIATGQEKENSELKLVKLRLKLILWHILLMRISIFKKKQKPVTLGL